MDNTTTGKEERSLTSFVIGGTEYKTLLNKKFENRVAYRPPNEKHILSYIPGTVLDVLVESGQQVKEGENILNLEAMKMKNNISSPFDGTIKMVHVKAGSIIAKGTLMIEFE